jgi:hypothetical protein
LPVKLVELVEDSRLDALQNHAVRALNLPVRARVHHNGQVNTDVIVITEPKEFLPYELRAVVRDDGVWYSEAVDDVAEE